MGPRVLPRIVSPSMDSVFEHRGICTRRLSRRDARNAHLMSGAARDGRPTMSVRLVRILWLPLVGSLHQRAVFHHEGCIRLPSDLAARCAVHERKPRCWGAGRGNGENRNTESNSGGVCYTASICARHVTKCNHTQRQVGRVCGLKKAPPGRRRGGARTTVSSSRRSIRQFSLYHKRLRVSRASVPGSPGHPANLRLSARHFARVLTIR